MTCPHLDYRTTDGEREFDHERAYCEVVDGFVAPLRADICNGVNEWTHDEHCEIYREHEGLD